MMTHQGSKFPTPDAEVYDAFVPGTPSSAHGHLFSIVQNFA